MYKMYFNYDIDISEISDNYSNGYAYEYIDEEIKKLSDAFIEAGYKKVKCKLQEGGFSYTYRYLIFVYSDIDPSSAEGNEKLIILARLLKNNFAKRIGYAGFEKVENDKISV